MEILVHVQNIQLVEKLLIPGRISLEEQDHYQRNAQHPYCKTEYPKVRMKHMTNLCKYKSRIPRAFSILQEQEKVFKTGTIKIKSTAPGPFILTRIYGREHGSPCNCATGGYPTDFTDFS